MITKDLKESQHHSRSQFDELYVKVMKQMWSHPKNEQRPVILRWLDELRGHFATILDIGAGDAYYLEWLAPQRYTFVEPNAQLYQTTVASARAHGIECHGFRSIKDLVNENRLDAFDLVLMIHVLLYLELDEIEALFPRLVGKPLVLVYPWPPLSITVQFEKSVGLDGSARRISLVRKFLGQPSSRRVVHGHFYMPGSADIESLAFLVSHCALRGEYDVERMKLARKFVRRNLDQWEQLGEYKIPQGQVLESYALGHLNDPTDELAGLSK